MPRYFCRVCDSNNGWVTPSGFAHETLRSHYGNFGFAYEEWNLNQLLFLNGFQHGWIEGFKAGRGRRVVPNGVHEIALYVRRNGQCIFIGKIHACENIGNTVNAIAYPVGLIAGINNVGGNAAAIGPMWDIRPNVRRPQMPAYNQIPKSNMRFKLSDAALCKKPFSININYTRYGALLVDGNAVLDAIWQTLP